MNSGLLPQMLISATIALMLSLVSWRIAIVSGVVFVMASVAMLFVPLSPQFADAALIGLWLTMIVTALMVYLPTAHWTRLALPMSLNAGIWTGACAVLAGHHGGLLLGLLPLFILIPARLIVARNFTMIIKVVASWMIAIATLSAFVSLVPTPGYKPDHMQ